MTIHVYPIDDLREHVVDGGECWCHPYVDVGDLDEEDIAIHNALDGREMRELGAPLH